MEFLLQGTAKWSYAHEMAAVPQTRKIINGMVSMAPVLHHHEGNIALSTAELIIEGFNDDEDLTIPLSNLKQIYLGFDDLYPKIAQKGLGLFWQPLRIEYYMPSLATQYIYLIIDFNGLFTHDKEWFNTLTNMLQ